MPLPTTEIPLTANHPRMPVPSHQVGPLLASLRKQHGYQFVVETDRHGETAAWLVRTALRVL